MIIGTDSEFDFWENISCFYNKWRRFNEQ